ncbi:MAG: hypothetical protein R3321_08595 [Nitrososphaeraceae archaeon]|nr:hypothetical protein [Nitrososphaeraceae archaeon]
MKYLLFCLVFISSLAFANNQTSMIDKVNWDVNQKFYYIPNNCLIVAKEKQRRLLIHGIKSKIIVILPEFTNTKHAVLCIDDLCMDNGDISDDLFNKNELTFYGQVL